MDYPGPTLFIYDINRKGETSQSAQVPSEDDLLQEYIETLQILNKQDGTFIMHSSYSPEVAHITIDSGGPKKGEATTSS